MHSSTVVLSSLVNQVKMYCISISISRGVFSCNKKSLGVSNLRRSEERTFDCETVGILDNTYIFKLIVKSLEIKKLYRKLIRHALRVIAFNNMD